MHILFNRETDDRLQALAARTGESAESLVLHAITVYLEDQEDIAKAKQVLAQNNPVTTQSDVERELGLN